MKMKTFAKAVALATFLAMPNAFSQLLDSTAAKFSLAPKAILRAYDNGQRTAAGIGCDFTAKTKWLDAGATGTLAIEGKKVIVEEGSVWAAVPLCGMTVTPYVYGDKYYYVNITSPAAGVSFSTSYAKLGVEKGKGFAVGYVQAIFGSAVPGVTFLEADGKLQSFGFSLSTNSTFCQMFISTQAQLMFPVSGAANSFQFRVSVQP